MYLFPNMAAFRYTANNLLVLIVTLSIFGVRSYLLFHPSYTSNWTRIVARSTDQAELTFAHGLGELPIKVVAVVKAVMMDGKNYTFHAVGTVQIDQTSEFYGGVICLYNETHVNVYVPNHISVKGSVVFIGTQAWEGPLFPDYNNQWSTDLPIEGLVQVKAYARYDFPSPDINVSWTSISLREAPFVFKHNLSDIPEYVVVQIKGYNSGLVSEAQGSVSILEPKKSTSALGGVIFGYSNDSINVWTASPHVPKATLFFVSEGWGSEGTNIEETSGFIQIYGWSLQFYSCISIYGTANQWTFDTPQSLTKDECGGVVDNVFLSVETQVLSGRNAGYRFPAVGTVMNDNGIQGDTSGLLFAYEDNNIYTWRPKAVLFNQKGYLSALGEHWANTLTVHKTNDVDIQVSIWEHFDLGNITCVEDFTSRFNGTSNSRTNVTSFAYGGVMTMECDHAYKMTGGTDVFNCTRNGVWDGNPIKCELITCAGSPGNSSIPNGWTYTDGVNLNNNSISGCFIGYSLADPTTADRICLDTEKWSAPDPVCELITCSANGTRVEAATMTLLGNKYNDLLKYECLPGFPHIAGDLTRTCQNNGSWSGRTPVCKYCMCDCSNQTLQQNYEENLEELVKDLVKQLTVEKKETSMAKRAKISVYEDRPTAKGLGGLGVFLLVMCFLLVIVPDIPVLINHIKGTT